jgi:hypothetical protein
MRTQAPRPWRRRSVPTKADRAPAGPQHDDYARLRAVLLAWGGAGVARLAGLAPLACAVCPPGADFAAAVQVPGRTRPAEMERLMKELSASRSAIEPREPPLTH